MSNVDIDISFPKGLLHPELFIGIVSDVTAGTVGLTSARPDNQSDRTSPVVAMPREFGELS
jgi:hypothetical protein